MLTNSINFEREIRARDPIKIAEFVAHSGLMANCKLELDNKFLESDPELADQIAEDLAEQMYLYEPQLIVPVPEGANKLGELVAKKLCVNYIELRKPERSTYRFNSEPDRKRIAQAKRIGLVDDVFTTGKSFRDLSSMPEFNGNVVVAGVIWNRSKQTAPKNLDFDLVSVVSRYVPLRAKE